MTYLVTGATGFIGQAVTRQLVARGDTVRAVVRNVLRASAIPALAGVTLSAGDVSRKETLREPMSGVDGVFHIAGWYKVGVRDRAQAVATNVDGTRNVLELLRDLRVPKGVYTSTIAVNSDTHGRVVDETYRFSGRHLSVYDTTKADAHRIAEDFIHHGLPLVIVQPGLVYGPGDTSGIRTMLIQYLERRLPVVPRGTAFAWGHIEDIARGHLLAMDKGEPGRTYFLTGPIHSLAEAFAIAEGVTGIKAPRFQASPALLRVLSSTASVLERIVRLPSGASSEALRVLAGVTYLGSAARAEQELGWHARSLEDGLRETLQLEREQRN